MKRTLYAAAFGVLLTQSLAVAATPHQAPAPPSASSDADEVVCEKQTSIGSRLAKKRKCLTRAQWAQERLTHRQAVEGVQRGGSSCTTRDQNNC